MSDFVTITYSLGLFTRLGYALLTHFTSLEYAIQTCHPRSFMCLSLKSKEQRATFHLFTQHMGYVVKEPLRRLVFGLVLAVDLHDHVYSITPVQRAV